MSTLTIVTISHYSFHFTPNPSSFINPILFTFSNIFYPIWLNQPFSTKTEKKLNEKLKGLQNLYLCSFWMTKCIIFTLSAQCFGLHNRCIDISIMLQRNESNNITIPNAGTWHINTYFIYLDYHNNKVLSILVQLMLQMFKCIFVWQVIFH